MVNLLNMYITVFLQNQFDKRENKKLYYYLVADNCNENFTPIYMVEVSQ